MKFLYLAIHYPRPEHRSELLEAMTGLGRVLDQLESLIEANAWHEQDGDRIVATSTWVSEEAFRKAMPVIGASIRDVPFAEWEARPRELYRLTEYGR